MSHTYTSSALHLRAGMTLTYADYRSFMRIETYPIAPPYTVPEGDLYVFEVHDEEYATIRPANAAERARLHLTSDGVTTPS